MSLRVRDVMTPDPSTVTPETLLTEVAQEIIEERYSGVPVVEDGKIVGLVEVGDLLPHPSRVPFSDVPVLEFQGEWIDEEHIEKFYEHLRRAKVEQVMQEDPIMVTPETPLGDVLRQLIENESRRLLVVDEDKRLIGVITRTDLLRVFARWP